MQLKHTIVILTAAGMLSTQAYANEAPLEALQAAPAAAFSEADMNALFEASDKPMQLAALSEQEMRETEGAFWPLLGFAATMYGHFTARSIASYYVSRFATVYGTYETARWLGRR